MKRDRLLFIRQNAGASNRIEYWVERWIERGLSCLDGLEVETYPLGDRIHESLQVAGARDAASVARVRAMEVLRCLETIRASQHENVFLINGYLLAIFYPGFFPALRAQAKRIITWQLDDPYYIDMTLGFVAHVDYVFTCDTATLPLYRQLGKLAEYLPLGCSPDVNRPTESPSGYKYDLCFVGAPFKGSRRIELLDALAPELAAHRSLIMGATSLDRWSENLRNYSLLANQIVDRFVPNNEALRCMAESLINLNLHKDSYGHAWDRNTRGLIANSPCERTFVLAGCGAFQLVDDTRPDLAESFEVGREIVTFSDLDDLREKIRYFLSHEYERKRIARAAFERAHAQHTYAHRAERIFNVVFGERPAGT